MPFEVRSNGHDSYPLPPRSQSKIPILADFVYPLFGVVGAFWICRESVFRTEPVTLLWERMGKWSYSLYLTHVLLGAMTDRFMVYIFTWRFFNIRLVAHLIPFWGITTFLILVGAYLLKLKNQAML